MISRIESGVTGPIPASEAQKILRKHGRPTKEEQEKKDDNYNVLRLGTSAEYLTARIARDRPDILERMKQGEFRSVRAADYLAQVATPANKPGAPVGNKNAAKVKDKNKDNNSNVCFRQGNDPEYLTSVIARDRPDILERMKQGEFRSVRAAAIEAGITKPKQTWTAPTDIPKLVRAIRQRYNETEIDILKAMI